LRTPPSWESPADLVDAFVSSLRRFRLDRQHGQPRRLMIAIEAAGMLPQIERITEPYGIPCYAAGGFDSVTAKFELAVTLSAWGSAEVLHIGDRDPSGEHLFSSLAEDVAAFVAGSGSGAVVRFTR
jgi:hypothetical protein